MGESEQGREYVIQEAIGEIAVRKGNWKYIPPGSITERGGINTWNKTRVPEPGFLFHLSEDPRETKNLAYKYPNKVKELRQIIYNIDPSKLEKGKLDMKHLGF